MAEANFCGTVEARCMLTPCWAGWLGGSGCWVGMLIMIPITAMDFYPGWMAW